MIFKDEEHERFYNEKVELLLEGKQEPYYCSLFYLMGLLEGTREHFKDVFDEKERVIKPESINSPWQTGGTIATVRLAFNLFNGFTGLSGEIDKAENYAVDNIFCKGGLAPYYFQAVSIRFEL